MVWSDDVEVESTPLATTGGQTWKAAYRLAEYCRNVAVELGLQKPGVSLIELGSGTGWLGITLARNMPHASLVCLTEQPDGLAWLQHNVELSRLRGLQLDHLRVQPCDWLHYAAAVGVGDPSSSSKSADGQPTAAATGMHTPSAVTALPTQPEAPAAPTGQPAAAGAAAEASLLPEPWPPAAFDLRSVNWDFVVGSDLVYNEVGSHCLPRVMAALAGRGTRILYCHTKHRFDLLDAELLEQLAACGLEAQEVWEPGTPPPPRSPPQQFPPVELFPDQRIAVFSIGRATAAPTDTAEQQLEWG